MKDYEESLRRNATERLTSKNDLYPRKDSDNNNEKRTIEDVNPFPIREIDSIKDLKLIENEPQNFNNRIDVPINDHVIKKEKEMKEELEDEEIDINNIFLEEKESNQNVIENIEKSKKENDKIKNSLSVYNKLSNKENKKNKFCERRKLWKSFAISSPINEEQKISFADSMILSKNKLDSILNDKGNIELNSNKNESNVFGNELEIAAPLVNENVFAYKEE